MGLKVFFDLQALFPFLITYTLSVYITLEKGSNDKEQTLVVTAFSITKQLIVYTRFYASLI